MKLHDCPTMPTAKQPSRSPFMELAVSAMMGVRVRVRVRAVPGVLGVPGSVLYCRSLHLKAKFESGLS